MPSALLNVRLIPLTMLVACGLVVALPQTAEAHPDHHHPTQQGDRHGNQTGTQHHQH
ncbi:hypothetical protein KBY85_12280 [Cyanobium sp. BA5m-10]|jgi:hypothetical protein|uniref:hypothetical protein n=1 Tax=Cyanobium sp. BA5m-10 TaxID=2823705 RepID=UPI0020CDC7B7|nr:hypothetical protein [Cyanobium sp. BA5m-10]MCP9904906.1 hypothetical protein [Cyanobium sp. BA5m-10]